MSYADSAQLASSYDAAATLYSHAWQDENEIPHAKLENELVRRMLGDCTGYRVLDLGGGSGAHARKAIDAGATRIDVVDISAGMMQTGQEIEHQAGRHDVIGWHVANAFKPIAGQVAELPLEGYDLVMAMWPFDHVANMNDLEGLWRNIAAYLKPGARLAAIRIRNPYSESARTGKYGSKLFDVEPISGGVKMKYSIATNPPFTLDGSSMETSYSGSTELPEKFGIGDIAVMELEQTDTVKADPALWEMMCRDAHFVGFTGEKEMMDATAWVCDAMELALLSLMRELVIQGPFY